MLYRVRVCTRFAALAGLAFLANIASVAASTTITPPPPPAAGSALWASSTDDVLQLSTQDASLQLDLDKLPEVHGLTVDQTNGHLWVDSASQLLAYDASGRLLISQPLPDAVADHDDDHARANMAADGAAGNLWLANRDELYRFDSKGSLQATLDLEHEIRGLTLDSKRSRLWVAVDHELVIFDANGNRLATVTLRHDAEALAYDAGLDQVWVTSDRSLRRYDAAGTETFHVSLSHGLDDFVAADGQGGAWVAGGRELAYFNSSGSLAFRFRPFDDQGDEGDDEDAGGRVHALVADPLTHSAWVADRRFVREYATTSLLQQTLDTRSALGEDEDEGDDDGVRLALFAPLDLPTVTILSPANNAIFNYSVFDFPFLPHPPLLLAFGPGVDPSTLSVTVNGQLNPVTCTFSVGNTGASCQGYITPAQADAVQQGGFDVRFTVSVTVQNFSGQRSQPASITIQLDPSL